MVVTPHGIIQILLHKTKIVLIYYLDDRNRTECVHQLRKLVHALKRKDFVSLGKVALSRGCIENDTLCIDERNLYIDIIAREGSSEAQLMILEFVMKHPNATEEDLRRCLIHAIALKDPIKVGMTKSLIPVKYSLLVLYIAMFL